MSQDQIRRYQRAGSIIFLKTKEAYGGLSNMAGGFPVQVNGIRILTSEALYQACRFPHRPDLQWLVIGENSPMTAKMKIKPHRQYSRPDWNQVRVKIMRWCLRVKLAQNWQSFSELLMDTGDKPIVEQSRKDDFWGAKAIDENVLVGMNVLGRLLMELRESITTESRESLMYVEPLIIQDFLLDGKPIRPILAPNTANEKMDKLPEEPLTNTGFRRKKILQPSLFDAPAAKEAPPTKYNSQKGKTVRITDLKPYADYKESGLQWLMQVPRHWRILPNRALFAEINDRNKPNEQMLSVTITRGIVPQKKLLANSAKKDSSRQDKSAYKLVQPKDIAYNKMRAWQGAIAASDYRGIISPAYIVQRLRNDEDLARYYHYLYRTPAFAKEAERWSYGITSDMWSMRPEHFKMIYSPAPPSDEQAAIVRFLEWANRKLELAIRTKRKVIALLSEQKQAIIHRAVTRGLDPDAPLMASGIPWLGDVPAHWELKRFKFIAAINSGQVDPRDAKYKNLILIAPNHIQSATGRLIKQETADEQGADSGKYLVRKNQVVYSKIRPNLRKATIAPCDCLCSADMYPIAPKQETMSTEYLLLLLLSAPFTKFAVDESMRVAMPKVNRESLANCIMWYPDKSEQVEIIEHVARSIEPVNTTVSRLEREIELLREYRTRLVADVVTGKLDVREAAESLPDEVLPELSDNGADLEEDLDTEDEEVSA